MATAYTKEEILDQLDSCARAFTFPVLDNGYICLADTRLSAYRDENCWAIIIEVLGYNVKVGGHDGMENCLYCFGNCLQRPPGISNGDFLRERCGDQFGCWPYALTRLTSLYQPFITIKAPKSPVLTEAPYLILPYVFPNDQLLRRSLVATVY